MSLFESVTFSLGTAESELTSFKAWLAGQTFLGETAMVAQLKSRPQMCCLLASVAGIHAPDLLKFELQMKGLFRTDLVLGNDRFRQFVLVEFEDARENSVFTRGTAQYRHWASRLEHGFGQIVDWAWVRNDHPNDTVLNEAFGGAVNESVYVVVCGRDSSLQGAFERKRFEHRRRSVKVEGMPVQIYTYDDMVAAMEDSLEATKSFSSLP